MNTLVGLNYIDQIRINEFIKLTFVEVMDVESNYETGSAVFNDSEDVMDDYKMSDEQEDNDVSESD